MHPDWLALLEEDAYAIVPHVIGRAEVERLLHALDAAGGAEGARRRESVYAIRNLLDAVPEVRALAESPAVRALVEPVLGASAFPVRGILFDKTPDANWKVAWHQDLAIAVRERRETPGFGPWSEKAGVTHVQPPAAVLERMLTVRVHLDDCGLENGPVHVVPGSHRHGRLDADATACWRESAAPVPTCTGAGGALLMRPLLLHASSPSTTPAHRRVVHIEYAVDDLPGGLEWHDRRRA
ncbi:MAG TPA: phytanoyl-CoA dioxygenase family protein [Longimicrobium sp.]|jgi:ectoine hydroxylase-related dioxygenase (phytanoyl-CoA dioxygenase family)